MNRRDFLKVVGGTVAAHAAMVGTSAGMTQVPDICLGEFLVAGFQYHCGMEPGVSRRLQADGLLSVRREADNNYDGNAMAILTESHEMLGYLPRSHNRIPACLSDQGVSLYAKIVAIDPEASPWERLKISLWIKSSQKNAA